MWQQCVVGLVVDVVDWYVVCGLVGVVVFFVVVFVGVVEGVVYWWIGVVVVWFGGYGLIFDMGEVMIFCVSVLWFMIVWSCNVMICFCLFVGWYDDCCFGGDCCGC